MKKCRINEILIKFLVFNFICSTTGCYSKFEVVEDKAEGTEVHLRKRYNDSERYTTTKYRIYSKSNKLIEKGKVSIFEGTWPETEESVTIKYDTLTNKWKEKNVFKKNVK